MTRALAAYDLGLWDGVLADLEPVLHWQPDNRDALSLCGWAYHYKGDSATAGKYFGQFRVSDAAGQATTSRPVIFLIQPANSTPDPPDPLVARPDRVVIEPDQTVTFTGSPMETKHLDVTLEKAPEPKHGTGKPASTGATAPANPTPAPAGNGKINVGASGGWCNVTIDGAARGATPVAGVELSAGPHRVTCTTPDGKTQTATVVVPADGVARHKFML